MNGLFDEPPPAQRQLSEMYSVPAYRASKGDRPSFTDIKSNVSVPCDECFANQHESGGASGPRAQAKMRRAFKGGPVLNLCRTHTALWRDRDMEDAPK